MKFIKYTILGMVIIVAFFLSASPPNEWHMYVDGILSTPLSITLQQSAVLILGGAVLGSTILLTREAFGR